MTILNDKAQSQLKFFPNKYGSLHCVWVPDSTTITKKEIQTDKRKKKKKGRKTDRKTEGQKESKPWTRINFSAP